MGRRIETGEDDIEEWSGGSDDALDAETEEEGWRHAPLTALPWGMQESGARGLRVAARAGKSDGRKAPSATSDKAGTRGRHGAGQEQGAKKGGRRGWERVEPLGVQRNSGWNPSSTEWECRRGAARPPEWRKIPGGAPRSGRGVELSQDDSTPNGRGGGVELWKDNSTQNGFGGGGE